MKYRSSLVMVSGHESPSSTTGSVEEESGGRNQRGGRDRIYLIFRTANVEATAPYHGWSHRRSRSGEIREGERALTLVKDVGWWRAPWSAGGRRLDQKSKCADSRPSSLQCRAHPSPTRPHGHMGPHLPHMQGRGRQEARRADEAETTMAWQV